MGIRLLKPDAVKRYESKSGAVYSYKEIIGPELDRLYQDHTRTRNRKIQTDGASVKQIVLESYLTDWEGIEDDAGAPVPFDKSLVKYLPPDEQAVLYSLITTGRELGQEEEEEPPFPSPSRRSSEPANPLN